MQFEPNTEAIGYGAVKYADLKNNSETSYTYQEKKMLTDKGDTAVYLLYAYARICSIIKKSVREINELKKEVLYGHEFAKGDASSTWGSVRASLRCTFDQ